MSPTTRRLNVSDWEAEIGSEREPRAFAADATALDVLRQRFRDISARTREHRQSAWINRPGLASLRNTSDSALELTRLAFHELSQFDNPDAPTIPLTALSQLLMENQTRLTEIDQRLKSLLSLVSIAESFRAPLESLIASGPMSIGPWKALLGELIECEHNLGFDAGCAWEGAALDSCLATEEWPFAWFYSPAIHRALWMLKLQRVLPEIQPYPLDALILPALLADCGLLVLFPEQGKQACFTPPPTATDYQRHPEISAALISLIQNTSPLSAQFASQHHERWDGTGFPRRLKLRDLNPVSRCFSVVARWSELLVTSAATSSPADPKLHAAQLLSREASQGAWDLNMVRRLLAAVDAKFTPDSVSPERWERKASRAPRSEASPPIPSTAAASPSLVRIIDGAETIPSPAMRNARVSAFKVDGPSARPTPPPRPAASGYR